jgi:hypothetical protein
VENRYDLIFSYNIINIGTICGCSFINGLSGLLRDDQLSFPDRLKIWQELNLTWLAFFQRILDTLQSSDSCIDVPEAHHLSCLGEYLVQICDELEPHGLVDYEMGIWEEEILSCEYHQKSSAVASLTLSLALSQCLGLITGV